MPIADDDELQLNALTPSEGFRVTGPSLPSKFGTSASGGGDVNGDGIPDVVVGAPGRRSEDFVYVLYGTGDPDRPLPGPGAAGGTTGVTIKSLEPDAQDDDFFGTAVAIAGDLNGDGIDDLVLGAPRADGPNTANAGEVYVVFGQAGGFPDGIDLSALDGTNGFLVRGEGNGRLGSAIAGAGDVNNDGIDDIIIGAPDLLFQGTFAGTAYVIYGSDQAFDPVIDVADLTSAGGNDGRLGFTIPGSRENFVDVARVGEAVDGGGDVNGDGIDDIIVGASRTNLNLNGNGTGGAFVIYGTDGNTRTTVDLRALDGTDGFAVLGERPTNSFDSNDIGDQAGAGVAIAGDVNGDGLADVVVGARGGVTRSFSTGDPVVSGTAHVVFGSETAKPTYQLTEFDGTDGFTIFNAQNGDRFGDSIASVGDVNQDGLADFIIAGPPRDSTSADRINDKAYLIYGTSETYPDGIDVQTLIGNRGLRLDATGPNELGAALGGAGDLNDDGVDDFFVTASAEVNTGDTSDDPEDFPRLYLVYGIKENGVGLIGDRNGNDETIPEDAAAGTPIGLTPSASDPNYADSVTLSLLDADARFVFAETGTTTLVGTRQGPTFGAVEVAEGALFDFETEPVVTLTVEATSTDGSARTTNFDITITNVEEGGPTTPVDTDDTAESLDDTAEVGSKIGVAVSATDPDGDPITFVSSDNRFEVDGDGNVVVSPLGKDAFDGVDEPEVIFDITAVANGVSSGPLVITLRINAVRSEDVLAPVLIEPASTLPEDAAPGTFTGLIVFAEDPDPFDAIERFEVEGKFDVVPLDPDVAGRRAVVLADGAIIDFEKLTSEPVTITAVSTDGSTASTTFQIPIGDVNEPVGPITDSNDAPNQIPDTAGGGVDTGVQASATDPDAGATVRYFNAGDNRFTVVPEDGRVLVQSFAQFNALTEPQVTATVEARSSDGSTTQQSFTIDVLGVNRPVGPVTDSNDAPNAIPETAGGSVDTGVQAVATDPDPGSTVRYFSVGDTRFTVVPEDGRVLVQTGASFDADSEPQVTATVEARSSDGTTSRQSFTIDVLDVNPPIANLRDANADLNFVEEDAVEGAPTGIRLALDNVDPGDTVSFSVDDERFTVIPVAGESALFDLVVSDEPDFAQFEQTTIRFDVTATGSDGGEVTEEFAVVVPNVDLPPSDPRDGDSAPNTLPEDAGPGTEVAGLSLSVDDDDTVYFFESLDPRFVIDEDGAVFVADDPTISFDFETTPRIDLDVVARPGGDFDPERDIIPPDLFATFLIDLLDVDEPLMLAFSNLIDPNGRISNATPEGINTGFILTATDPEGDPFELLTSDARFTTRQLDDGRIFVETVDGARFDPEIGTTLQLTVTALQEGVSVDSVTLPVGISEGIGPFTIDTPIDPVPERGVGPLTLATFNVRDPDDLSVDFDFTVSTGFEEAFRINRLGFLEGDWALELRAGNRLPSFDQVDALTFDITARSPDQSTSSAIITVPIANTNTPLSVEPIAPSRSFGEISTAGEPGDNTLLRYDIFEPDADDIVTATTNDSRFEIDRVGSVIVAEGADFNGVSSGVIELTSTFTSTDGSEVIDTRPIYLSAPVGDIVPVSSDPPPAIPENVFFEDPFYTFTVSDEPGFAGSTLEVDVFDSIDFIDYFRVVQVSGDTYGLASRRALDFETVSEIEATIRARSSDGSESRLTVPFDVLDIDEPLDTEVPGTVSIHDRETGLLFVTVAASDPDGDPVDATFIDPSGQDRFTLQPSALRDGEWRLRIEDDAVFDGATEPVIAGTVRFTAPGVLLEQPLAIEVSQALTPAVLTETGLADNGLVQEIGTRPDREIFIIEVDDPDSDVPPILTASDDRFEFRQIEGSAEEAPLWGLYAKPGATFSIDEEGDELFVNIRAFSTTDFSESTGTLQIAIADVATGPTSSLIVNNDLDGIVTVREGESFLATVVIDEPLEQDVEVRFGSVSSFGFFADGPIEEVRETLMAGDTNLSVPLIVPSNTETDDDEYALVDVTFLTSGDVVQDPEQRFVFIRDTTITSTEFDDDIVVLEEGAFVALGPGGEDAVTIPSSIEEITLDQFGANDRLVIDGLTRSPAVRTIDRGSVILGVDLFGEPEADLTLTLTGGPYDDESIPFSIDDFDLAFDPLNESAVLRLAQDRAAPGIEIGLYDAQSDDLITLIEDGDIITLSMLDERNLTIAAIVPADSSFFGVAQSMALDLNDGQVTRVENVEPYALFGDRGGDFAAGSIATGENTITFDIYSEDRLAGDLLGTVSRSFTLLDDLNTPPIIMDDFVMVSESEGPGDVDLNVLDNDQSGTGAPIAVVGVQGDGGPADAGSLGAGVIGTNGGFFTINADGSADFDANGAFEALGVGETTTTSVEFGVGYADGTGPIGISTLTATVEGENDAPMAMDDMAQAGGSSTVLDVLDNDTDPDANDTLTIAGFTQPALGEIIQLNAVSLIYLPDEPFAGTDSFEYTVSDGNGGIDTATVTIEGELDPQPLLAVGLYDAESDTLIMTLEDGIEIGASTLAGRALTIAAFELDDSGTVESAFLNLNNGALTRTENVNPYALFGDRGGDFRGGALPLGENTITIDAYAEDGLAGALLESLTIGFTITDGLF